MVRRLAIASGLLLLYVAAACGGGGGEAGTDDAAATTKDGGADAPALDDGGASDGGVEGAVTVDGGVRLRVVASNLSSGASGMPTYDDGPGKRILTGLHPDVVLMQEFIVGGNAKAAVDGFVHDVCGASCVYFQQPSVNIPNGVISRYPIVASGVWDDAQTTDRDFVWAKIDVPGPHDLYAVSLHLLTKSETARADEATALVALLQANVPAGSFLVLGGDFNTSSRSETAITTLAAVVDTGGPFPVDNVANENTNAPRSRPYDWVLPNPALSALRFPVLLGTTPFPSGLVVDTRVYTPIGDLAPATADDSDAANMQHMAVVRDFLVPE